MPPSIWPMTDSGLSARPTSCAVAIWMTRTRPSSTSTSTTARWATNANATWHAALAALVELLGGAVAVGRPSPRSCWPAVASATEHPQRRRRCRRRRCPRSPVARGRRPCLRRRARTAARARPGTPCRSRRRTSTSGATPTSNRPTRSWCRPARARPRRRRGSSRAICCGDRDEALPDLGRGELERDGAVGEPAACGGGVVEPLGVHEVLDRDARSRRRASRARQSAVRPAPPGSAASARRAAVGLGGQRQRGGLAEAAHRRAPRSRDRWPVTSRSPVSIALRNRISTGSSPHAAASLSIWLSCAKHACCTPNPRIAPHGGLFVRTAHPSMRGVRAAGTGPARA